MTYGAPQRPWLRDIYGELGIEKMEISQTEPEVASYLNKHEQIVFERGGQVVVTFERKTGERASFMIFRPDEDSRTTKTMKMRYPKRCGMPRYLID